MVTENVDHHEWYQSSVGAKLIDAEKKELSELLPRLYGYHLAFLGDPGLAPLVESSLISHRVVVCPEARGQHPPFSCLRGEVEAIPMLSDSVDVVVLSHTLEHVANPHEVLRETHRVLIPEGHIVITGFNPISLWGMWHAYQKMSGQIPAPGRMLSLNRVKDWLTLLNFQILGAKMFYFRPPMSQAGLHSKMAFMERWGEKCWPFLGGAYTLLAVKRVVPLTPIRPRWRLERNLWQGAAEGLPKPTTTLIEKKNYD